MGVAAFPHCSLAWGQGMIGIMATSCKRTYASMLCLPKVLLSVSMTSRQAGVTPHLHQRPSGKSDSVSCGVTAPFSWVLVHTRFPQPCGFSAMKSHRPSKAGSLGILSPLPDPQIGKSVVGPRTFATVQKLLWYNWSLVYGSTTTWLYTGANGDLLHWIYATHCLS